MVNHESSPSRVRKKREEENNSNNNYASSIGTPSKRSKRLGKEAVSPDVSEKISPKKAEDGNNGSSAGEKNSQEVAEIGNEDGNAPSSVDPGVHPPAGGTAEAASRPEPPAQEVYRIPSYAAWFRWDKVHPIERRTMSEFFDKRSAAKTPRIYKEYRDFIINKYRENPMQALTFNEVRRMLIGDVNSLSRVFDFLEHWGLINQQSTLEQAATERDPPLSLSVIDSYPSGINVVRMPVFNAAKTPGISTFESSGRSTTTASHVNNLATRKNVFLSASKKLGPGAAASSKKPEEEVHCHSCKKDCSKQRFYKKQQPGSSFCSDCVKAGKLPAGTSAIDLIRAPDGDLTVAAKMWTSKETLLLLEAVSRYGENWNQVAAHVPTRSKLECVSHFIQLPFGDGYFVEPEEPTFPVVGAASGTPKKNVGLVSASTEEAALSGDMVPNGALPSVSTSGATHKAADAAEARTAVHELVSPFTDASHPLFSQIALLSGMVGPRVAAAAAQAAVAAIAEDDPGVLELPFIQSSKSFSSQKKHASQTMQINAERLTDESTEDLQSNGEGPAEGDKNSALPPNDPDAPNSSADGEELPSAVQARISVATALGVAAANAKLLADQEEREIEHLVSSIIDNQMKKLYSKLEHFEELEMLLEKERLEVERTRQLVYADRLRYAEAQTATAKTLFRSPGPSS